MSKATNDAGAVSARRLIRDSARMDPLGHSVEVQGGGPGDHDLPVEHPLVGEILLECYDQLGEIPGEWFLVPAAQFHVVAVPDDARNPSHLGS
jgi:hypothetical protein